MDEVVPNKPRDYVAEYRRRIENAKRLAKGLGVRFSRRQARGHPGKGEFLLSTLTRERRSTETQRRFEKVIRLIRSQNLSLAKAAKQAGTTPRTIKKLNARFGLFEVTERRRINLTLPRLLVLTEEGRFRYIEMIDPAGLSLLGRYWNAVKRARRTGDDAALKNFEGRSITCADGEEFPFVTNLRLINKAYKTLPEEKSPVTASDFMRR